MDSKIYSIDRMNGVDDISGYMSTHICLLVLPDIHAGYTYYRPFIATSAASEYPVISTKTHGMYILLNFETNGERSLVKTIDPFEKTESDLQQKESSSTHSKTESDLQ